MVIALSACGSSDKTGVVKETSTYEETEIDGATMPTVIESSSKEEMSIVSEADNAVRIDFIFPDSDKEFIEFEAANLKSDEELRIGRNEIYARHGRKFSDEKLLAYFNSKEWYQGTIVPENFDESVFSNEEKRNIEALSNLEWYREALRNKQPIRYDYDGTEYIGVDGIHRKRESNLEGEYIVVTPIDLDHISVESHTFWGDKTIEFERIDFNFEGPINYNNESTKDYKDGHLDFGRLEVMVAIDGNDCVDYYTR